MAAQDVIYARLLKDFSDKDIQQQLVSVSKLWYYFDLINQIAGGGGGGVATVTGNIVDNTDPANPIVTQLQADWNEADNTLPTYIVNKPTIPTGDMVAATYDPAGLASQLLAVPVVMTVDDAQAFDIGNFGVTGQEYEIVKGGTDLPTGVKIVVMRCIDLDGVKGWDTNGYAFLTSMGKYYPCKYDIYTNKIEVALTTTMVVSQSGTSAPTVTVVLDDLVGYTWTPSYSAVGSYGVVPSGTLSTSFNKIILETSGVVPAIGAITNDFQFVGGYYDSVSDVLRIASQYVDFGTGKVKWKNGVLNETPIKLTCILSN